MIVETAALRYAIAFAPTLAFATIFFFDALFLDQSIVHGDSIVHGLSVIDYHAGVLAGDESMLWSDKLFAGHPVFAESQFAFLSPLNLLVVATLDPVTAHNVFHWACLLWTGLGTVALGFGLGLGLVATTFAATAVAMSGMWLDQQQNLAISGALAWVPWALWGLERWLQRPRAFLGLSLAIVMLVFSGYPQVLYATLCFMFISLLSFVLSRAEFARLVDGWRDYLRWGLAAVIVAVGLAAVQLLPLVELVGFSHRSEGVSLIEIPGEVMLRGIIYAADMAGVRAQYFWLLASTIAAVLVSAIALVRLAPRLLGYALATFVLFNLGLGQDSPLFNLVYAYNLLPGITSFRMCWPYFAPAIVGMAVLAGAVIDQLPRVAFATRRNVVVLALLAVFWAAVFVRLHDDMMPVMHYVLLLAMLASMVYLLRAGRPALVGVAALVAFFAETALLKLDSFNFHPRALLDTPGTVHYLRENADLENYRVHDVTLFGAYSFVAPRHPEQPQLVSRMMAAVTPSTNLLWDIFAWGGAHALPQSGRILLEPVVTDEINGATAQRAGRRFTDILAMRYITARSPIEAGGFQLLLRDEVTGVSVYENRAALPRFHSYAAWEFVQSQEEALALNQASDRLRLWVQQPEGPVQGQAPTAARQDGDALGDMEIELVRGSSTHYHFALQARQPGWFFISDANYPGWRATLDGDPVTVYTAQILGKAVWVPAGSHQLELRFESLSFQRGLVVSLTTLGGLVLFLLWSGVRSGGQGAVRPLPGTPAGGV